MAILLRTANSGRIRPHSAAPDKTGAEPDPWQFVAR
jgi:hypothetical protein